MIKNGVRLLGMSNQILVAIMVADKIWMMHGQELVVTSVSDGKHGPNSLHYSGNAADLRTRYFTPEEKAEVGDQLGDALGDEFDVVIEKSHIHVEYQPGYGRV